jgi:hypothetical protein
MPAESLSATLFEGEYCHVLQGSNSTLELGYHTKTDIAQAPNTAQD